MPQYLEDHNCSGVTEEVGELFHELGFCGCGCPDEAFELLRQVLAAFSEKIDWDAPDAKERYKDWAKRFRDLLPVDDNPGLAYSYLYWMDSKNLIEHGSGILSSWLTEDGRRVLAILNDAAALTAPPPPSGADPAGPPAPESPGPPTRS